MRRNDFLKLIALAAMTIDHIGAVLLQNIMWLRLIGRIAFPIFAYCIAIGYQNTKNLKRYLIRLFIFGVISQPIYFILFSKLNIFFTLFCALLLIHIYEKIDKFLAIVVLTAIIYVNQWMDYGAYGVALCFCFHVFSHSKRRCIAAFCILNAVYFLYNSRYVGMMQSFSIVSLLFIYKKWEVNITLPKYFFYCFYPIHMILLYLVKELTL